MTTQCTPSAKKTAEIWPSGPASTYSPGASGSQRSASPTAAAPAAPATSFASRSRNAMSSSSIAMVSWGDEGGPCHSHKTNTTSTQDYAFSMKNDIDANLFFCVGVLSRVLFRCSPSPQPSSRAFATRMLLSSRQIFRGAHHLDSRRGFGRGRASPGEQACGKQ